MYSLTHDRRTQSLVAIITICWGMAGLGCDIEKPCGDDLAFDEVTRACRPLPAQDAGARADAGADTATRDGGMGVDAGALDAGPNCSDPGYGTPCANGGLDAPECTCAANYCAIQPGETEGICTSLGCVASPEDCPPDYTCLDLTVFAPEVGSFCLPN